MGENQGIYDAFPGHRLPAPGELDAALRGALVVVDANVLLNLYRYTEGTRSDLLAVLTRLGHRLFVPHQALKEFWRHRLPVLTTPNNSARAARDALGKQRAAAEAALHNWAKAAGVAGEQRDALLGKLAALHRELDDVIAATAPPVVHTAEGIRDEPVLAALDLLLAGKVGPAPDPAAEQDWIAEGTRRAEARQPPGYLDAAKADSGLPEGPAGDYLVWRAAVHEARDRGLDLVLVTADEKEDWWLRHRDQFLGPRLELVEEFRGLTGRRLFLLRPAGLLERAGALELAVRRESVADAARVGEPGEPADPAGDRAGWTAEGVQELLRRLDAEGLVQAEVIRIAARQGGRIGRDEIYDLAGYDEHRMLRGFTRPSARITQDLQEAGLVADGVDPALTPVYTDMRATAFVVPPELVALLSDA